MCSFSASYYFYFILKKTKAIHKMEYPTLKKSEVKLHQILWVDLTIIMLNERGNTKQYRLLFVKTSQQTNFYSLQRHTGMVKR